ncbi:MAG TPA: DUF5615 family PIN-like protein [Tepidisphaeraceae bacterium]|jgi:predicted nuclease of predicted toxin-antitoxin system
MAVRLYMDVHVPVAITEQLRRRGVDVLTAAEDGATELPDDELLARVRALDRLLFTQDIRFEALARQCQVSQILIAPLFPSPSRRGRECGRSTQG